MEIFNHFSMSYIILISGTHVGNCIVLYCNNLLTKHVTHNINIMHSILKAQNNNLTGRSEVIHQIINDLR